VKKLLKFLVIAAVLGAVVVVIANASRRKASAPVRTTPWEAPTVEGPEAEVEERVRESEDEGMTPAPEEQPVDVARGASGEVIVSELAAPGAAEQILAPAPAAPEEEPPSGPSAAVEEEHPEDAAIDSEGAPIIIPEFSAASAEQAELDAEAALLEALAESEALDDANAEFLASLEGAPTAEEAPLDIALHEAALEEETNLELLLDEAEARGLASEIQEELSATTTEEPDILTRAFDELASTPESPAEPAAPIEAEPEVRADEHLLSSVEEALGDLEPAPIVPPPRRTAESYLDEGNVYFNVGQYGLAIERYGQAIELDPNLTAAYYNRANAHTRAGDFEKALADYNRALELQPMDADALNNRGMLHLYRANYREALADFNRALEIDPSDTTVMVNRGLAQLHSGNAAAALVDFREAATMDSGDAAAQYGAAQAAASLGNRDEALRHVARALELDPSYAREAAADPRLQLLQGDEEFLRLLRESGSRSP